MLFKKDKPYTHTDYLEADEYNHCASICPHKNGVLIAWYSGKHEASTEQQVRVVYWENGTYSEQFSVGMRTGNPVIWAVTKKRACLLYSYFERLTNRVVSRWKYCSNWIVPVEYKPNRKTVWASYVHNQLELNPTIGCLGRCQPIKVGKEWLLPLYREHDPCGVIMASKNGWEWEERGVIGQSDHVAKTRFGSGLLMQPTLWSDGSRLFALCRNIARTKRAYFSQSLDMGKTWSEAVLTSIPNTNNSLVAIHDGTENPWLIWNAGYRRSLLLLGKIDGTDAKRFYRLNGPRGAYPNYCFDNDDNIHMIHTEGYRIKHWIVNRAWLNALEKGEIKEDTKDEESLEEPETSQPDSQAIK